MYKRQVEEGLEFFRNMPKIARKLQTLYDVGLGYIKLGPLRMDASSVPKFPVRVRSAEEAREQHQVEEGDQPADGVQ